MISYSRQVYSILELLAEIGGLAFSFQLACTTLIQGYASFSFASTFIATQFLYFALPPATVVNEEDPLDRSRRGEEVWDKARHEEAK